MNLQHRLSSGKFVILAEMHTPKGVDISDLITNARGLKGRVDAVIIPDMDNGVMRMSALAGGALISREGIESMIHIYARDRNRLALQGDILAAHVLGIKNLLVVQGEEMRLGDHREANPVDDMDELELIRTVKTLQGGKDSAGFDLAGKPSFGVGCTMSLWTSDRELDLELEKTAGKIEAGAQFIILPPMFEAEQLVAVIEKIRGFRVPVISTVFILKSVGVARYMSLKMDGINIPEELIQRIRKAGDREDECLRIAGETIAAFGQLSQGVRIETMGWEHKLPIILDYAGR
ncbi:MAG: 5,10-methylenetetrahydrofolate reductase [Desulfobacteraceae bacterium]|nr:5,10-methylenetetrahydrofolate reductase [Desulfobacteraceae bacterium]